jgi:ribosome assembly protein YihI (activator of Der GTPase)
MTNETNATAEVVAPVVTEPTKAKVEKKAARAEKKAAAKAKPAKAAAKKPAKVAKKATKAAAKKPAKVAKPKDPNAVSKSVIPLEVAKQYHVDKDHKTISGNPSIDNNDKVAKLLRGQPIEKVYSLVAKEAKCAVGELQNRYGHLNVGMQRMNLGNKLRGILNAAA